MGFPKSIQNFFPILRAGGFATREAGRLIGMKVINKTGSDIAVDKLVAISGFDVTSKLPKIVLADADSADLATDVYVALAKITNGAKGNVWKGGTSGANLNTSAAATVGDPLYLDTSAGGFTSTAPAGTTARVQVVGYSLVKDASVGQIRWDIKPVSKLGTLDLNSGTTSDPNTVILAATATTTTNVLASLTGFSWTLVAGATYRFEVNLPTTQTANGGLTVAFKYTTATLTSIQVQTYQATASDSTTAASSQSTTTTDQTKWVDNKTAAYTLTNIKGTLVVNAGGSVAVQFAQNTTNSDTTSILLGAYANFTRVS